MKTRLRAYLLCSVLSLSACKLNDQETNRGVIPDRTNEVEQSIITYMNDALTTEFGRYYAESNLKGMIVSCVVDGLDDSGVEYRYTCMSDFPEIQTTSYWLCTVDKCEIIRNKQWDIDND